MFNRRIWLVRHGYRQDYVEPNWPNCNHYPSDTPLSHEGRQQASELVNAFSTQVPAHLFVSPYLRTVQTAQPLSDAYSLSVKLEPGIGEIYQGGESRLSLSFEDSGRILPHLDHAYRSTFVPKDAETAPMAGLRAANAIEYLLQCFEGDLLLITHETPIRGIVSHLLKGRTSVRCTFCGITELQWQDSQWRLVRNGDVGHLSEPISSRRFVWDYVRRHGLKLLNQGV